MNSVPQIGPALKAPGLNQRLGALVAARWPLGGPQRGTAPVPERLACRAVLGVARVSFGYAVNLRFAYRGTQPEPYIIEGYITGYDDGPLTGEAHARSCSCPDFEKRRGPARDQLRGEERCCKHMVLFLLLASLWRGRMPWGGILGMVYPAPSSAPKPPFTEAQAAVLAAPGRKSNYQEDSKAGYRMGRKSAEQ